VNCIQYDLNQITIRFSADSELPPLGLFVSLDTHESGCSYYESTIYIAAILEVARCLTVSPLPCPIQIAFLSGLSSSSRVLDAYIDRHFPSGNFFYFDALGTGRP
jgi:hypothetical protein